MIDTKIVFMGLGFGIATLIFGMLIFKIFRMIGIDFNNDIILGLLLMVSGSLSYIAYQYVSIGKIKMNGGSSRKVQFNDSVEVWDTNNSI